jgi:hypothetical protein
MTKDVDKKPIHFLFLYSLLLFKWKLSRSVKAGFFMEGSTFNRMRILGCGAKSQCAKGGNLFCGLLDFAGMTERRDSEGDVCPCFFI